LCSPRQALCFNNLGGPQPAHHPSFRASPRVLRRGAFSAHVCHEAEPAVFVSVRFVIIGCFFLSGRTRLLRPNYLAGTAGEVRGSAECVTLSCSLSLVALSRSASFSPSSAFSCGRGLPTSIHIASPSTTCTIS